MLFIKKSLNEGGSATGGEPEVVQAPVVIRKKKAAETQRKADDAVEAEEVRLRRGRLGGLLAKLGKTRVFRDEAAQPADAPGKAAGGLFSRFRKAGVRLPEADKPASDGEPEQDKADGVAGGLLAKLGKTRVFRDEAAQPADAPGKAKGARSRKRRIAWRAGGGPAYVGVMLEGGDTAVWWAISGKTLTRLADRPDSGTAVVFSRDDTRVTTEKPVTGKEAEDLAFQETGEECAVVNASRSLGVIYATPVSRLSNKGLKIIPGLLVLEAAARMHELAQPSVAGFDLAGEADETALLVLGVLRERDGLARTQTTLRPENRQFSIDQFVAQQRGELGGVTLFGLQELLDAAATLSAYPTEPLLLGRIPRSKAKLGAVVLSGLAAAAGVGAYLYVETATAVAKKGAAEAERAKKHADLAAAQFVEGRVGSLAAKASLDPEQAFKDARAVWVPRSVVRLNASLSEGTTLVVVFSPSGGVSKQPLFPATRDETDAFLARDKVGECLRTSLSINGATNEISATYQCPNAGTPIPGYGLD